MDNHTSSIESLVDKTKSYVDTRVNLFKLKAVNKTSEFASIVISYIAVVLIFSIVFIFINIGLALWIGQKLGEAYYGFFIIGGFYAVIGIIIFNSRDKLLKAPIADGMIKKLFD